MKKLCKELAKYRDLLSENKIIREITSAWAILIVILFTSCETLDFNEIPSDSEDNPTLQILSVDSPTPDGYPRAVSIETD